MGAVCSQLCPDLGRIHLSYREGVRINLDNYDCIPWGKVWGGSGFVSPSAVPSLKLTLTSVMSF